MEEKLLIRGSKVFLASQTEINSSETEDHNYSWNAVFLLLFPACIFDTEGECPSHSGNGPGLHDPEIYIQSQNPAEAPEQSELVSDRCGRVGEGVDFVVGHLLHNWEVRPCNGACQALLTVQ